MSEQTIARAKAPSGGSTVAAIARQALQPGVRGEMARRLMQRLWSQHAAIGFRRDLSLPFTAREAKIPITIRQLAADEAATILGDSDEGLDTAERWERASRQRLFESGLGRCFAAIAPDDRPCYVQWIFLPAENEGVQSYFSGTFPVLGPDEALLEGAFTPAAFRGMGIMPAAMAQVASEAGKFGATYVHTFVGDDNMPSLKGCIRAGFEPWQWREIRCRLLRRESRFGPLPEDISTRFAAMWR